MPLNGGISSWIAVAVVVRLPPALSVYFYYQNFTLKAVLLVLMVVELMRTPIWTIRVSLLESE